MLVAGLMVTVAATTSQVVLWRFAQDQKSNLERLTGVYLNGLSARVLPALVRGNQREVFDVLDLAQSGRYPGFEPRFTIVELRNETILASSDPRRFPVQSAVPTSCAESSRQATASISTPVSTALGWRRR